MARIRSIKPEFWTDEKVVGLSPLARLLFIGLWNFVDDEGRAAYSPARLKMQILPADPADISEILGEIRGASLITVYVVDGKEYFEVNGFSKHQKIDKRTHSKIPPPPNPAEFPRNTPVDQGKEGIKEGNRKKDTADAVSMNGAYFFESGVIRLKEKDFNKWAESFSHLDLRSELTSLTQWAAGQGPNWFHAVAGALAKRNRGIHVQIEQSKNTKPRRLTPSGNPWPEGID